MDKVKKIALLGPESTGKTELSKQLAAHFHTVWVPEFARQYLQSTQYAFENVVHCLVEQVALESQMETMAHQFLFCDTELINFKVWFSDMFNKVPGWLDEKIKTHRYDLTLLTYPDISFEEDILRTNAYRRDFFFNWYKKELEAYHSPYVIIKGFGEERLKNAVNAILNTKLS
jgi:NadR type nicotinamide-nucleotide adenylyltransferase